MLTRCNWFGYEFESYPKDARWPAVPGVYIFAKLADPSSYSAVYVGQAEAFSDRLPNHERWAMARLLGATEVHVLMVPSKADRDGLEALLIKMAQPPLNKQLK